MSVLVGGLPFAKLQVLVVEATDLFKEAPSQLPSLYCKISHVGKKEISLRTDLCKESKHPKWYEEFVLVLDDLSQKVKLSIKDEDKNRKAKYYGDVSLDLTTMKVKERIEEWFPLTIPNEVTESGSTKRKTTEGKLKLVCFITPMSSLPGNYVRLTRKLASFRLDVAKAEVVSGGFIEGAVTLLSAKPVELNRIYLRVSGTESVSWTEEDWEVDKNFTGTSTIVNKWYHGWENSQKTIDPGYYNWKFRIKIPAGLPPTFESMYGKIKYEVFAYMDHDKFTDGTPLTVLYPVTNTICPETYQHKHNMQVSCSLDKPVYHVEDSPIRLLVPTSIKNYSDYRIKSVKVKIFEKSSYSANNNVTSNQRLLFKQHYRSIHIGGHQKWEGKLLADLPVDYRTPTITKSMGANRITCTHHIKVIITKDTPLVENKVYLDLSMTIASKGEGVAVVDKDDKKQLISLRKDLVVTSPDSPVVNRRKEDGEDDSKKKRKSARREKKEAEAPAESDKSEKLIDEEEWLGAATASLPVKEEVIDFTSPLIPGTATPVMSSYTNVYNPYAPMFPSLPNSPFASAGAATGTGTGAVAGITPLTLGAGFNSFSGGGGGGSLTPRGGSNPFASTGGTATGVTGNLTPRPLSPTSAPNNPFLQGVTPPFPQQPFPQQSFPQQPFPQQPFPQQPFPQQPFPQQPFPQQPFPQQAFPQQAIPQAGQTFFDQPPPPIITTPPLDPSNPPKT